MSSEILKDLLKEYEQKKTKAEIDETVEALNELLPVLKKYVRK